MTEIYGVILTYSSANITFFFFKEKTAFINICDKGNRLREVNMDGFILRYSLVKFIRVLNRAVFYTGRTTRAFVLYNVSWLLDQGCLKVSCFPFYTVNFSKCQDLYIWMPADLDQFG